MCVPSVVSQPSGANFNQEATLQTKRLNAKRCRRLSETVRLSVERLDSTLEGTGGGGGGAGGCFV